METCCVFENDAVESVALPVEWNEEHMIFNLLHRISVFFPAYSKRMYRNKKNPEPSTPGKGRFISLLVQ